MISATGSSLAGSSLDIEAHCNGGHFREAALITFLVTLSGVVIAGVGSAFWGVAAGVLALFVQKYGRRGS